MRATEIEAIGELLGEALDATGQMAQETHEAIANRTFAAVGPVGRPVQVVHDGISRTVYRGVRSALRVSASHGGRALARRVPEDAPALTTTVGGSIATGALNGFCGDLLAERDNPLALRMSLRHAGEEIAATPEALAEAYPSATPRLAVFIHGLCETDDAWRGFPPREDDPQVPFGRRMQLELGFTPVYVRFNSGLHISDNGRELARLLEDLSAGWPGDVEEIALVGHSMGGLIARSACHFASQNRHGWADAVKHVFCLGTPHLGADLEKGVHLLDWALGQATESRAFSRALRMRSAGIKDLRFGSCAEEDWHSLDPDEFFQDRCTEVPFLPHAHYYFVGATLAPTALGHVLGDLLVRAPSASGQGRARRIPFHIDNGHTIAGITHFDLLGHPDVYEQIRTWIERPPRPAQELTIGDGPTLGD